MKIPVLRGRNLMAGDSQAMVVSESLALLQWPGEDAWASSSRDTRWSASPPTRDGVRMQDPDAVEAYYLAGSGRSPRRWSRW